MKRKVYDTEGHAHYLTFSCYKNRKLLNLDRAKKIVIHFLAGMLELKGGHCLGFVVMPDHVHAIVWFDEDNKVMRFVQQWKRRSSQELKKLYQNSNYVREAGKTEAFWQAGYYDYNLYSDKKIREKISYMHMNPVRAELVEEICDWKFSSALWYEKEKSVGVKIGID